MRYRGVAARSVGVIAGLALVIAAIAPAGVAYGAFAEQVARLHATDGATNDFYGHVVDIDGDTAVVGSPWDDSERGSAYVYIRTAVGWAFQQRLTAPVTAVGDHFGQSAAVSGDVIVVGAPGRTVSTYSMAGTVYVFR
ncbi:MAG: FG-GAP repeat protein, partial [Coriobacteriia bacterium]|nr:FG-GAP repeat protein [Coriobacteriia bacterium]